MDKQDIKRLIQNGEIEFYTSHNVSKRLGITRQQATNLLRSGKIIASKAHDTWITTKSIVEEYLKNKN